MKCIVLSILILAGCQQRVKSFDDTVFDGVAAKDPVWMQYAFRGAPRAYAYGASGWQSTGRDVTANDIAKAPCKVILGKYVSSEYVWSDDVIHLDTRDKIGVLWHESQHCRDMRAGMRDVRELERRAMIAEMGDNRAAQEINPHE